MGKKSDKDYITYSEWTNDFGGAKVKRFSEATDFKSLPFYCCTLSLRPCDVPVCTADGDVFDFMQIIPYLRKNGNKHPHTGADLRPADLIKVHFHRNENGEYFCPITRKSLNEHSKIVVNRRTGNVYSWEAVDQMNIRKNCWLDLLTEEPFERSDLIILQDPMNPKNRAKAINRVQQTGALGNADGKVAEKVNLSGGVGRVLKELRMTELPAIEQDASAKVSNPKPDALHALAPHSTGRMAASLTSTSMSLQTVSERALLDEAETLSKYFPSGKDTNGTICIRTNFGDLFFTLFASKSPRCVYNFIELAKRGYYDNGQFHRLVKGFVLQGGDPDGTGRGGESCWARPFGESNLHPTLSHNERGLLSMANAGDRNANGSQFFITLRPCLHLDGKHPIFGKLLAGDEVLEAIESEVDVDVKEGHRPLAKISIEDVIVLEDPFEIARQSALKPKPSTIAKPSGSTNSKPSLVGKYLVTKPTVRK